MPKPGPRYSHAKGRACADMSMSMNMGGRPTKLTPRVAACIYRALRSGLYIETAVVMAGISRSTFYYWLKRAADDDGIYREFSDTVAREMAYAEIQTVAIITEAAKTDWKAGAWLLERRFSERWSKTSGISASLAHRHTRHLSSGMSLVRQGSL